MQYKILLEKRLARYALLLSGLSVLVCSLAACALMRASHTEYVGDMGRFEYCAPENGMSGIVIGAPRGGSEPSSADYARWISKRTGAGLVVAYGFAAKRISVTQPIVGFYKVSTASTEPRRPASVFPEFKKLLKHTTDGNLRLYLGIRFAIEEAGSRQIDLVTSGFTFEEVKFLKQSYLRIRDRLIADKPVPKMDLAAEPLDDILWSNAGVKHHGVLMIAKRGLNLRLPRLLQNAAASETYRDILSLWISHALPVVVENSSKLPHIGVRVFEQGRLESIPSRRQQKGVVIGAPHGTFDEYTAEVVRQISFRTGIAAVIAKGFTPTEGGGWRINVNRPTERRYPGGEFEIASSRAKTVYENFKEVVLEATKKNLELYFDVHQNGREKEIQVATVGISRAEARTIKKMYRELRDRTLKNVSHVESVELLIEPIDAVQIGAWAAKAHGILSVAKKSLHFELPLYSTLARAQARHAYTSILNDLIDRSSLLLVRDNQLAGGGKALPYHPRSDA